MHDAGCLGLVHWDDPEGWYGEGGGRRVQDGFSFKNLKKKKKKRRRTSGTQLPQWLSENIFKVALAPASRGMVSYIGHSGLASVRPGCWFPASSAPQVLVPA